MQKFGPIPAAVLLHVAPVSVVGVVDTAPDPAEPTGVAYVVSDEGGESRAMT